MILARFAYAGSVFLKTFAAVATVCLTAGTPDAYVIVEIEVGGSAGTLIIFR